jgi:hypothetical protein
MLMIVQEYLEVVIKALKYKVLDQCVIRENGVKLAAKVEG